MEMKWNAVTLIGSVIGLISAPCAVAQDNFTSGGDGSSWSDNHNWSGGSPYNLGSTVVVTIGTTPTQGGIQLDLGSDEIASLSFLNNVNSTFIEGSGGQVLTVDGSINNSSGNLQVLELPSLRIAATSPTTWDVGTGGLAVSNLNIGTSHISVTGSGGLQVTAASALVITINSATTFGTIGPITMTNNQVDITSTANYAGTAGDFFQLISRNSTLSGITLNPGSVSPGAGLSFVSTLLNKGILFVEPTAGGTVINSNVILPIDMDSEFNPNGTITTVTFNGTTGPAELLTDNSEDGNNTPFSTARNITINSSTSAVIAANTGTTATYNGIISDQSVTAGTLTIGDATNAGLGTVDFAGANTYAGATNILSGATLKLGAAAAVQNSTVTVNAANGITFATGVGTFTLGGLSGSGNETLADTGGTAITLQVGNNNSTTTYSGVLSGTGALTKLGTGTFTLSSAQAYTGPTTVSGGTLKIGTTNGIASGNSLTTATGATFDIAGNSQMLGALTNGGTVTSSTGTGALTIGNGSTGAGNFTGTMNVTFTDTTTPSALTGTFSNTGTVTLNANGASSLNIGTANNAGIVVNSGSGTGTAAIASILANVTGVTQASSTSALIIGAISVNGTSGTTLKSTGTALTSVTGAVSGTGNLVIADNNTGSITLSGGVNNGGTITNSGAGTDTTTISGAIGTAVTNVIENSTTGSQLVLSGANAYTGATTVTAGTVKAGSTTAFGNNSAVTVGTTGVLDVAGFSTQIGSLTGTGTVTDSGASATLTTGGLATSQAFSGVITAGANVFGLTKIGTGTQTLSGSNTYTGATTVTGGTLKAGVASVANTSGAFGDNSAVTVGASGVLDIGGFATQIGSLTGSGSVTDGGASAILSVGGDNTSPAAFTGTISDGTGTLSLTKIGTGTETLSHANTYSGTTTVNGGTLAIGATNAIKSGNALTTGASGTFDLAGNNQTLGVLTNGGNVTGSTGTSTLTIGDGSGGAGTFTTSGTGTLNVVWNQTTSNTSMTSATGFTNTGNLTLANGGTGTITVASANNKGTITHTGSSGATAITAVGSNVTAVAQQGATGSTLAITNLAVNGTSGTTLSTSSTGSLTVANATTGTGNLVLNANGSGGITLAGAGNSGTITNSGSTGTTTIGAISNAVTGITENSTGSTLFLNGANASTGTLSIAAGTVKVGTATSVGAGPLSISSTGTLDLNGTTETVDALVAGSTGTITNSNTTTTGVLSYAGSATATTYGGKIINGAGTTGLTIASGDLILSGANTYTGLTTVSSGTLALGASNAIASGNALTTAAGGVFDVAGKSDTLGDVTNAGNLTSSGPGGALTLGGGSTSSGTITGTMNLTLNASGANAISISSANNSGSITNSGTGTVASTVTLVNSNVTGITQASNNSALTIGTLDLNSAGTTLTSTGTSLMTVTNQVSGVANLVINDNSSGGITLTGGANNQGIVTNSGTGTGTTTLGAVGNSVTAVDQNSATSTLLLSGTGTYSTLNIEQGTTKLGAGSTLGTATLGATGAGTLDLNGQTEVINTLATAGTAANQTITNNSSNAATLDFTGASTSTFGGAIKNGTGTTGVTVNNAAAVVTLSGANTYSGATLLSTGTINVSGSTGTSAFTLNGGLLNVTGKVGGTIAVNNGAVLTGAGNGTTTGVTGAVTVGSGGTIDLTRNAAIGTLHVGNLSLTAGTLDFEIGSNSTSAIDSISAGSLTIGAGQTSINISNLDNLAQTLAVGNYTLLSYTNSSTPANLANLHLNTTALDGDTLSLVTNTLGQVVLNVVNITSTQTFTGTSPTILNIISGSTAIVSTQLNNTNQAGGQSLAVNLADGGSTGGTVTGLTSTGGGTVAAGGSTTVSGTFTAGSVGTGKTYSISNTDPNQTPTTITTGGTVNVYNHAVGTLTATGATTVSAITGTAVTTALTFTNSGANNDNLTIVAEGTGVSNLSGTFSGNQSINTVIGTTTAGAAGTQTTVNYGATYTEDQNVVGATAGNQNATAGAVTINSFNHADGTLVVTSASSVKAIAGSTINSSLSFTNSGANNDNLIAGSASGGLTAATGTFTANQTTTLNGSFTAGAAGTTATNNFNQTFTEDQTVIGATTGTQTATAGVTVTSYTHANGVLIVTSPTTLKAIAGTTINSNLTFGNTGATNDNLTAGTSGGGLNAATGVFTAGQSTTLTGSFVAGAAGTTTTNDFTQTWVEDQTVIGATAGNQTSTAGVTVTSYNHANGVLTVTSPTAVTAISGTTVNSTMTFTNSGANNDNLAIVTPGTGVTGLSGTFMANQSTTTVHGATVAGTAGSTTTATYSATYLEDQSVLGATTTDQTATANSVTITDVGHSSASLSTATANFGFVHAGTNVATQSTTLNNGAGPLAGLEITGLTTGLTDSGSGLIAAGTGRALNVVIGVLNTAGSYSQAFTIETSDDQTVLGATANANLTFTVSGNVYSGQGVWAATGSGTWGTIASPTNWQANGGAPGLDTNFTTTDSATFGNSIGGTSASVSLGADVPSLNAINFTNTMGGSYTIGGAGDTGMIKLNAGTGNTANINNQAGNNTIAAALELDTNAATTVANGDVLTLTGAITGANNLTINGPGTTYITAANTGYTGATTVNGTLAIGNNSALGNGVVTLDSGSTLEGDMNSETLANNLDLNGAVSLGSLAGGTLTVNGTLTGNFTLTKTGTGTLALNGANNSTNGTTVAAGTLVVGNVDSLGSANSTVTLGNGAAVDYTGASTTLTQNLTVVANGTGTISNTGGGTLTLTGTLTKANSTLIFSGGAFIDDGTITGGNASSFNSDLDVTSNSTMTINVAPTYFGPTRVYGNSTLIDGTATLPAGTVVDLGDTTDAGGAVNTFNLNGNIQTVAGINTIGTATNIITNNDAGTTSTLTLSGINSDGSAATSNFGGIIQDGGATALTALAVTGGTHMFTRNNTYSGGTTVSGGTVIVGNANAFGVLGANALSTVTLHQTGGRIMTDGVNHTINVAGSFNMTGGMLVFGINTVPNPATGVGANNDVLNVGGSANIASGATLALNIASSVVPTLTKGSTFEVITTTTGATIGAGVNAEVLSPAGFQIVATLDPSSVMVTPGSTIVGTGDNVYLTITSTSFALAALLNGGTPNENAILTNIDQNINSSTNPALAAAITQTLIGTPTSATAETIADSFNPAKFGNFVQSNIVNNAVFSTQEIDTYLASGRSEHGDFLVANDGIDSTGLTVVDPSMDPALAQTGSRLLAWSPAPFAHGMLSDSSTAPLLTGTDSKAMTTVPESLSGHEFSTFVVGNVVLAQNFSQPGVTHSDSTTGGVQLGADYRVTPHLRTGVMFGFNHTDASLDNTGSKATIDTYAPGGYISYADGGWYANAVGNYGFNSYTEDRSVSIGALSARAHGAPTGDQLTADLDGGYDFHYKQLTFGPLAGLEYTHLTVDSYNEDGADGLGANLAVGSQTGSSLRSRLGGHVSFTYQTGKILLTPHLDASWQHEFMNQAEGITGQFTGAATPFSVTTTGASRDSVLLDGGLNADITGQVTVFGDYLIQAGQSNYFGQSVQAGVKIGF